MLISANYYFPKYQKTFDIVHWNLQIWLIYTMVYKNIRLIFWRINFKHQNDEESSYIYIYIKLN